MQSLTGQKKPWLAALLNALIFPFFFAYPGYLYLENWRRFFLAFVISATPVAVHQLLLIRPDEGLLGLFPYLFTYVLCPIIFAIDGWRCAKEHNTHLEREKVARELSARRFGIGVEHEEDE